MVLGGCTQRSETSGDSTGHQAVCAPTQNQEPIGPVVPVLTCAGDRPVFFLPAIFRSLPIGRERKILVEKSQALYQSGDYR